jgi:haloalkane dehalogenase
MPVVLLTTVCRPFGGDGEGCSVGAELFHAQVTRAQGLFSLRQVIRCWALDYLAENIDAPSVVLHYPSEREFVAELKSRHWDFVGINFVVATFHKVRRMVKLCRQHAPGAKIILGGYGTVLPEELLAPFGDFVCREEGVGFMRKLLGERTDRPILHPYAPIPAIRLFSRQQPYKVGHLTAGLGCPNGCDFCCTSHFFKQKYVPLLETGRDVYDAILKVEQTAKERGDKLRGLILIDEDFFLHHRRAREFLECVREGGKPLSLLGFGSVKGLSRFSADEIAEMGFDTVWTAFEGRQSGYDKLQGKPIAQLYHDLQSRGVGILSSMIIGFPYQDRNQVLREFNELLALGPTLTQILIYFAFPGTPFHRVALAEGRYLPEYQQNPDLRRWDGFSLHFTHPHFTAASLESLQQQLYQLDFERLGPSIVRLLKVWFDGYKTLRNSPSPLLRARAERKRREVKAMLPVLGPAMTLGPTAATRAHARALLREMAQELGEPGLKDKLMLAGATALGGMTWLADELNVLQQPALLRIEHRLPSASPHEPTLRLQGGMQANPALAVLEEVAHNLRGMALRAVPALRPPADDGFSARVVTRPKPVN